MATEEVNNTQGPPPVTQPSTLPIPDYSQLIIEAIEALNEEGGSSKSAIEKHIESTHPDLPAAHSTLLSHHLNRMKQSGQLVMLKDSYLKPDPNAPPKRGRGRPPKPKTDALPPGVVISPPRPRGRPPKPKDPFSPPKPKPAGEGTGRPRGRPPKDPFAPPKPKTTGAGTGRPRGRPPKKAKTTPTTTTTAAAVPPPPGMKRGRGRPPKV